MVRVMVVSPALLDLCKTTTPCVAAVLAAIIIVTPHHVHALSLAPTLAMSGRPIVALEKPVDHIGLFMEALAASTTTNTGEPGVVDRVIAGGSATATAPDAPVAVEDSSNAAPKSRVVGGADPYFERWQKDADERLKEENAAKNPEKHPLAAAHSDMAVVVCEAGCGTPKDEIVYIAAVVPAVVPDKEFEPSSSESGAAKPATSEEAPCIAGCYSRSQRSLPVPRRHAAAAVVPKAANTNIIYAARRAARHVERRAFTKAVALASSHRPVKARARSQAAHNGAIVEYRDDHRQHAKNNVPTGSVSKGKIRRQAAALKSWRAKVTYAVPRPHRRDVVQRVIERSKHVTVRSKYARYVAR
jgi:hypothetical protein